MAKVRRFTRHFVQRWAERMGGLPSIEEVNALLLGSLRIIKQEVLYRRTPSGAMVRHKGLSHYWSDAAGMIVLVDDYQGIAITVVTPDMKDKYNPGLLSADGAKPGPASPRPGSADAAKACHA